VAVTASTEPQSVMLYFLRNGSWLRPVVFCLAPIVDKPASLDMRLRELIASLETPKVSLAQREQHLALLAKWFYSSWRDGEWLGLESFDAVPYQAGERIRRRLSRPAARVPRGLSSTLAAFHPRIGPKP
jgi:hypothetical protein